MFANVFHRFIERWERDDGDYVTNPFILWMGKLTLEKLGNCLPIREDRDRFLFFFLSQMQI